MKWVIIGGVVYFVSLAGALVFMHARAKGGERYDEARAADLQWARIVEQYGPRCTP